MLQIRLNKGPSSDGGSGVKSLPAETVTVACPDHLVLADLPVAKGLGSATSAARVKTVGRRSRRQLGERVHFCVRCDFPITIYGRLTPCEHVFCLDCARSDSMCYLCDDRIQKIQTIKLMEGIFICAAPHCLKSFLKRAEFESHIHGSHGDLLQPNTKTEEVNESDGFSVKPSAASESSTRAPQKPLNDRDDRGRSQQSREQTPLRPLMQPRMPPDLGPDGGPQRPDGFNRLPQHNLEASSDKPQQGILSDSPQYPPVYYQQPPNFAGPNRPPFAFPPFYGTPMNVEVAQSDSTPDSGMAEQAAPPGFSEPHAHSWGGGVPFEAMQGVGGDPQARGAFFQGRNSSNSAGPNKALDSSQVASMPPPGPPPPHLFSGDPSHDGKNYGWSQHQKRQGFGSS